MTLKTLLLVSSFCSGSRFFTSVNGQAINGTNVFRYFGSCFSSPCPSAEQECCEFEADTDVKGKFCMYDWQKLHPDTLKKVYFGTYVDNEYTYWDWVCRAPTAAEIAEQTRREREASRLAGKPAFFQEQWVEILLWVVYISGIAWIPGFAVSLPLGSGVMVYLWGIAIWNIVEVFIYFTGDLDTWLEGPLRRAYMNLLIFSLSQVFQLIPGINILSAFLFAWWGLYSYFDYQFDPIFEERPDRYVF